MLETLVPSKIRCALWEYLLTHPHDRFYLRGLAKELNLSITPLRRELKRLEQLGVLQTVQEANVLFYTINTTSAVFQRLVQHAQPSVLSSTSLVEAVHETEALKVHVEAPQPTVSPATPAPIPMPSAHLRTPMVMGVVAGTAVLLLIAASVWYLSRINQRLATVTPRAIGQAQIEVMPVPPQQQASSSVMRGQHWQVIPGGFGGFSSTGEQ